MPAPGQTTVFFNDRFFDEIMRSAAVVGLCEAKAQRVLAAAKASAPVDSGAYRAGLAVERHDSAHRAVVRVVGSDAKTLLVESKTGNLARALRRAGR